MSTSSRTRPVTVRDPISKGTSETVAVTTTVTRPNRGDHNHTYRRGWHHSYTPVP